LYIQTILFLLIANNSSSQEKPIIFNEDTLAVLSWNLHLLPAIVFYKHQIKRSDAIVSVLLNSKYDVIVFQEAFHKRASAKIWEGLSTQYPYSYGPGKRTLLKFGNGVWILSKLKLINVQKIGFDECSKWTADCRARKGAVFVEVEKGGQKFQIIGTHVQSKEGSEYQKVRDAQFLQITNELIEPNADNKIPVIVVGDLNTAMGNTRDYQNMLNILGVVDGALGGTKKFTIDGKSNDMIKDDEIRGKLLDFILVKPGNVKIKRIKREIVVFKSQWRKKNSDISDHYAIEANICF